MTLKNRLDKLERTALHRGGAGADEPEDDHQWLHRFKEWHGQGLFGDAADVGAALDAYAAAIMEAEARPDWEPPASFQPGVTPVVRLGNWRSRFKFPVLNAAWERLAAMSTNAVGERVGP